MALNRILKLEMKNISLYALSVMITQAGSFILIPIFWKTLTPHDYGIIAVTEVVGGFLSIFFGFG
ncbi:hypothetical protein E3A20_03600 [Planctomyces bekefii]|uniref:MFS transporter n=1 Tax=Planctomyces bekefii TaxID=1653850 RepID=A0A5C6MBS6_9PLAN|nr:hypothetical protein E3A20_03600 [Planctomyces bekefii]